MLDHPKANPATSATPTPALYAHEPIFLAISAYAIPVPKNRTYTNTNARAGQFHPSTTCDATSGTINRPSATSATRSIVFPSWFIRVMFSLTIPTNVSQKIHSANPNSPRTGGPHIISAPTHRVPIHDAASLRHEWDIRAKRKPFSLFEQESHHPTADQAK